MSSSPSSEALAAELTSGMVALDTAGNPRIPVLMQMVGSLSRAVDPQEALLAYSKGIAELGERTGYVSLSVRGHSPGDYRITRMLSKDDDLDAIAENNPWRDAHRMKVHRGGFLGEIIKQAYPQVLHNVNLRNDPVVGDALAEYGSVMAIPLFDDGEPLNWAIMLQPEPDAFSIKDLEDAILRANLIGSTIKNVLAAQQLREANERVHREVEQIARIQRSLLPRELPRIPGVSLGAHYETFDRAGGDLYTIAPIGRAERADESPWAVLIADASGHGPAAAVVTAMLYSILEAYPRIPTGPAEVLAHANDHLVAKRIEHSFVTAFLGLYHPRERKLVYARAGHNPPVHMKHNGDGWRMNLLDEVGSVPLGIMPDVEYDESTVTLDPGQTVVLYTDGITEAMGPDDRMFGVEGIEQSLTHCSGEPDCAIHHITSALLTHEAGRRPSDDQTLVIFRVDESS